jgi:hypothetical protein
MTAYPLRAPARDEPDMPPREREAARRERDSLADALVELAGHEPQTLEELHAAAVDEWGSCTLAEVSAQVLGLRRAGLVRRQAGGYVAAGGWR